jgi:hypothetical protein
MYDEGRC